MTTGCSGRSAARPAAGPDQLTDAEREFFAREQALHESRYLAGSSPPQQSDFGRDAGDWERFRRPVVAPIDRDGSFLDIGCANGLLIECVVEWAREAGHHIEPFGLDISAKLAELRTELVYVPASRSREYLDPLLARVVAPHGRLLICSYGSSRPEGARAEPLVDDLESWGHAVDTVDDVVSPQHGFVITRVVSVSHPGTTQRPVAPDETSPDTRSTSCGARDARCKPRIAG